ncbi:MAG TPA: carboxymuconolactone decarboxylase family protein [Magnetospirillum sp.]|nr:carboxymuconolactone decarboxylase family protein [Magnetospirillum sp.]
MDERTKELIALGASAAVNCHPCLDHHLAEAERVGLSRAEVTAAIEVGLAVNRGAAARMRAKVDTLTGKAPPAAGCGCAV